MAVTSLANEAVAIGIGWGVHVLFIPSVGLEVSRQFLLMV